MKPLVDDKEAFLGGGAEAEIAFDWQWAKSPSHFVKLEGAAHVAA